MDRIPRLLNNEAFTPAGNGPQEWQEHLGVEGILLEFELVER